MMDRKKCTDGKCFWIKDLADGRVMFSYGTDKKHGGGSLNAFLTKEEYKSLQEIVSDEPKTWANGNDVY